ncbi:MAG: Holliday junction branch migration DNA helicase RuvB [Chloroflexota bacterium]
MSDRLVSPTAGESEQALETSLRPKKLEEYIGQEKVKENLHIFLQAAKARGDALEHVLLYGPPGLGKTTLANIIAAEMQVNIRTTSGPAIEHQGDLAAILTNMRKGDVLFIDEIHRLSRVVEEALYPAMEDFVWDMIVGKGPTARTLRLSLQKFTIIGATTRMAMLSSPLRDRFGAIYRLDFYSEDAIQKIVKRSAKILGVKIEPEGAAEVAKRSRGTPRVANRLLRRVRDYAQVMADGVITQEVAQQALERLEVDHLGLDDADRSILKAIIEKFDGGPVGIETVAAATNEDADTVMDVYEPYLLQLGLIARTPRGRVATRLAYQHLGVEAKGEQGRLL